MPNPLDYGRRRSRRDVLLVFAAVVIALTMGVFFGVKRWRLHRARLADQQAREQLRKLREQYDRQLTRQLAPSASTRPSRRAATSRASRLATDRSETIDSER